MNTYDTKIIQYVIHFKEDDKPFKQKLRKVHPTLEPLIQKKLMKLLDVSIFFKVQYSSWVVNLVSVRKKSSETRLCMDFQNLNREPKNDNHPIPLMG